jgi:hypothetical protein
MVMRISMTSWTIKLALRIRDKKERSSVGFIGVLYYVG